MLRESEWRPTKFVEHGGGWRASRDAAEVSPASRLMADRIASAYTTALRSHARGSLLDVGCGHVPLYGCYREYVDAVTCVDWPNTAHPSPHVDVHVDLSKPLPLDSGTFDTILATDVLEHLPYPDRLWSEMTRLLRPGGKVILGVPFMYWLHEQPHDHHRYTEHRLRLFCVDHGLSVLDCRPYGGSLDVAADVLSKILNRRGLRRSIPAVGWAARRLSKASDETSMPLGYVLVAQLPAD